jgi:hypothetical protein
MLLSYDHFLRKPDGKQGSRKSRFGDICPAQPIALSLGATESCLLQIKRSAHSYLGLIHAALSGMLDPEAVSNGSLNAPPDERKGDRSHR